MNHKQKFCNELNKLLIEYYVDTHPKGTAYRIGFENKIVEVVFHTLIPEILEEVIPEEDWKEKDDSFEEKVIKHHYNRAINDIKENYKHFLK